MTTVPAIECRRARGCLFYFVALTADADVPRRELERRAVGRLVEAAFGPDAVFGHRTSGAPFVVGSPAAVSVSHSARCCLLAVDPFGRPIGVDVEHWRPQLLRVAPRVLMPDELSRYAASQRSLLMAWAAKEAVFKAAGDPSLTISVIRVDLDNMSASTPDERRFRLSFARRFPTACAIARPAAGGGIRP